MYAGKLAKEQIVQHPSDPEPVIRSTLQLLLLLRLVSSSVQAVTASLARFTSPIVTALQPYLFTGRIW